MLMIDPSLAAKHLCAQTVTLASFPNQDICFQLLVGSRSTAPFQFVLCESQVRG